MQVPAIPQEVHHEEYYDEDDEEMGYHEDVVISESNHTIPNYDEANEIRMLTEAANNSLRTMEEHFNPPKRRRSRKKKIDGEQDVEESSKPKRRRRPQHLYFNEQGEPTSGRTKSLLKGLENLNLPVATAGTAPMSPPAPKPEPQILSPTANKPAIRVPGSVMQHPPKAGLSEVPRHVSQSRLTTPYKMPELSIPQMVSPQMMSPHVKAPNVASPHMMSPSIMSPQMISPRMVSPGQPSQLSPRTISATQKKHPLLSTMLSVTSPGSQALRSNVSPPSGMVSPLNQLVRFPRNVAPGPGHFSSPPRVKLADRPPQPVATPVVHGKQGVLPSASPPAPQILTPPQFPMQHPRQQQIFTQHTIPTQPSTQEIPRTHPPQQIQAGSNVAVTRVLQPDLMNPSFTAVASVPRQPLQNPPRFQPMVNSVPTNQQPIPAQMPPVHHEAVMPSGSSVVNMPKSGPQPIPVDQVVTPVQGELPLPSTSLKTHTENAVTKDTNANSSVDTVQSSQVGNEPKPKIQELIKSELLAAAWESRQPMPHVSLPEKKNRNKYLIKHNFPGRRTVETGSTDRSTRTESRNVQFHQEEVRLPNTLKLR